MNSSTSHPHDEALLRFVDEDLPASETHAISEHLAVCSECRDRIQRIRGTLDDYRFFHEVVLKASLAPPPREWGQLNFPVMRRRTWVPLRWLAAAAAIAVMFLVFRRVENVPEVRAAELLRKAAGSEESTRVPARRIRIRTRTRDLERAARVTRGTEAPEAAQLRAMFDAAGYSWEEPLSARAFSRWRDSVRQKRDQVTENGESVVVRTFTATGDLDDAALTMRATDLRAIACSLHFRSADETIDITEVRESALPAPSTRSTAPLPISEVKPAGPADELRVIAALHGIGADLGEPIQVERDGAKVLVSVTGLDEARRRQIRSGVAAVPNAEVRFEDLKTGDSHGSPHSSQTAVPAGPSNPLLAELQARRGDNSSLADLTDRLMDGNEKASERAYAMRALARRFPPDVAATFTGADLHALRRILHDHVTDLAVHLEEIRRLLNPILRDTDAPPRSGRTSGTNWQPLAESLPTTIEQLDRSLNGATDASDVRRAEISRTLAELQADVADLQNIVKQ
jgi:anti-sigma factor RsiW